MSYLSEKLDRYSDWFVDRISSTNLVDIALAMNDSVEVLVPYILMVGLASFMIALPIPLWSDRDNQYSLEILKMIPVAYSAISILFSIVFSLKYTKERSVPREFAISLSIFSIFVLMRSFQTTTSENLINSNSIHVFLYSLIIVPLCTGCIELEQKLTPKLKNKGVLGKVARYLIWFSVPGIILLLELSPLELSKLLMKPLALIIRLINWMPFMVLVIAIDLYFIFRGTALMLNVIHGLLSPFLIFCLSSNAITAASGSIPVYVITEGFIQYGSHLGGTGGLIGLRIALKYAGNLKSTSLRQQKDMIHEGNRGCPSEFYLYGVPVCQNSCFFFSFLIIPVILESTTFYLMKIGCLSKTVALVKWNMVPGLSAFIMSGGDYRNALWQLFEIAVLFVSYLISLKLYDRKLAKEEGAVEHNLTSSLVPASD